MKGYLYAIGSYGIWGLFPLYFHLFKNIHPMQLVVHRIIWSFILLIAVIIFLKDGKVLLQKIKVLGILGSHIISALMIGANWLIYIWAVENHRILEGSMGYFLNPLFTILLGVIVLNEKLKPIQWLAFILAGSGIVVLTTKVGAFPWISVSLAVTFGIYGLLKKRASISSIHGLFLESAFLIVPAMMYLLWETKSGHGMWNSSPITIKCLLMTTGVATVVPLSMFSIAARRIPLSHLGFLQYLTPTIQFLLGVFIFHEVFDVSKKIAFGCIWLALVIASVPWQSVLKITRSRIK